MPPTLIIPDVAFGGMRMPGFRAASQERADLRTRHEPGVRALREMLLEANVPAHAILRDLAVGGRYKADVAVVDPRTQKPLAFFEIRQNLDARAAESARRQLVTFAQALGNPSIPLYLASDDDGVMKVVRLTPEPTEVNFARDARDRFPPFRQLVTSSLAAEKVDGRAERRRTVDRFKLLCWLMALLVVAVLVMDFFGWYTLNGDRLALMGAAAALVVIPYASKLKMLGVEFERGQGNAGAAVGGLVSTAGGLVDGAATNLPAVAEVPAKAVDDASRALKGATSAVTGRAERTSPPVTDLTRRATRKPTKSPTG